jgi:3-oxoacyl-[acyl-carrier-protein] synthase-3
MYAGCEKQEDGSLKSWADYPSDSWLKQSIFAINRTLKF